MTEVFSLKWEICDNCLLFPFWIHILQKWKSRKCGEKKKKEKKNVNVFYFDFWMLKKTLLIFPPSPLFFLHFVPWMKCLLFQPAWGNKYSFRAVYTFFLSPDEKSWKFTRLILLFSQLTLQKCSVVKLHITHKFKSNQMNIENYQTNKMIFIDFCPLFCLLSIHLTI